MPKPSIVHYHFNVEWDGRKMDFTEVTGLSMEYEIVEYREGGSSDSRKRKVPGQLKYGNITLKRGVQKGANELYSWMMAVQNNQDRKDLTINLLNERQEAVCRWKVRRAWPCKMLVSDLRAGSKEVAMECIEIVHEGLELEMV